LHEKASTAGDHTSATVTTKTSAQKKSKGNTAEVIYSYVVHIEPKERRVGGPPLNWKGPRPSSKCKVVCKHSNHSCYHNFVGNLPLDMLEDDLMPLLQDIVYMWSFRLPMNPSTNLNRGYAFIRFTAKGTGGGETYWILNRFHKRNPERKNIYKGLV
jgi:hypothetical protein